MDSFFKYGLILVAGIALGAIGATVYTKNNGNLKPLASDLISRGINVKDAIAGKVESIKEDIQDFVAEAQQKADQQKVDKSVNS